MSKRAFPRFAIIAILSLSLLGCASLLKGPYESVGFGSDPVKAKVYVNGAYMGETPLRLFLPVRESYSIEFKKEGYVSQTVLIGNGIGVGWIVLDVIGGLIPVIVDAATGDWMYLDQTNVNAALERQQ